MSRTKPLHSWDVTCREAVAIQKIFREKLILCDESPRLKSIRLPGRTSHIPGAMTVSSAPW